MLKFLKILKKDHPDDPNSPNSFRKINFCIKKYFNEDVFETAPASLHPQDLMISPSLI